MKEVVELKPFDPEKELDPNKLFIYEHNGEVVVKGLLKPTSAKGLQSKSVKDSPWSTGLAKKPKPKYRHCLSRKE
jgi:hypothetical protein